MEEQLVVSLGKKRDAEVTVRHRAAKHNVLLRTSVSEGGRVGAGTSMKSVIRVV